ncbi:oligopeptide/dipeptide ABC transporter ATP-binding protein [Paenibacillus sp. FSL P4-0127]|uniref:oligopeptide/dipeptide ABC transporter ATP-binding protein n=2 Tax=unclassified Paenibacillus TaxID=185978 RepID=UPI0030F6DC1B
MDEKEAVHNIGGSLRFGGMRWNRFTASYFPDSYKILSIQGEIPSPLNPPSGCAFYPRCPFAAETCRTVKPARKKVSEGHFAACHLVK